MQKQSLDDNYYNIAKQLVKKLEFLSHAKGYVNDAKKYNTGAEEVWTRKTCRNAANSISNSC